MKKLILSILLSVCMLVNIMPISVFANQPAEFGMPVVSGFEADTKVLYSTYVNKSFTGILVETADMPDSTDAYGVEIAEKKYPATSVYHNGVYIVDIEGLDESREYEVRPYYTIDGTDVYSDSVTLTTAAARTKVSGYSHYSYEGDHVAVGYGIKAAGNGGAVDFIGHNGTTWLQSTYNSAGWAYIFEDDPSDASSWVETNGPKVMVYQSEKIQAWVVPETSADGNFGILTYYIRNLSGETIEDYKFGAAADIKIGSRDSAPIAKTDYGISMTDGENTFALIGKEGYSGISTPVSTIWFGHYSSARSNVYTSASSDSLTGTDSGASYSWQNITLEPGEIKEFKLCLGIGDTEKLESLLKPDSSINYADETLTGLTPASTYIITVGTDRFTVTADLNGTIRIIGTDDNNTEYNLIGKSIAISEIKEIDGSMQVGEAQEIIVASRPDVTVPDYNAPDDIAPELPDDLDVTTTENSVTIRAQECQEYSIDGGNTWQIADSSGNVVFSGLDDGIVYNILTRIAATDSSFASEIEGFEIKTSKMFTITDVTVSGNVQVYDGTAKSLAILADGATASYSTVLEGPYSSTFPEYTDAGAYTVYYKLEKSGYHDYYNVAELQIKEKEIGIAWTNTAFIYDGTLKLPTATATDVVTGDEISLTVEGAQTNASETAYTATVTAITGEKAVNYKLPTNKTTQFTIGKATPEYSVPTGLTAIYSNTLAEVTLPTGWTWKDAETSVGNVGENTFTAVYTHDNTGNYETVEADVTVTVSKLKVEKPAANSTVYTYNGNEQTYVVAANNNYTVTNNKRTAAGSQVVTVVLNDTANTEWADSTSADVAFTFTVNQREIGIAWANTAFIYDGTLKLPTATATDVVTGDEISLTVEGAQTNASETAYTATVTAITGEKAVNYKLPTNKTTQFTIGKATPEYSVPTGLTAIYSNTLAEVTLPTGWTWKDAETSVGNVGENTFTAVYTHDNTGNYETVEADVTVTVSKLKVEKPAEDSTVYTYNGNEQTYVVAANNNYTVTNNKRTAAGSQVVTVALNDTANTEWADGTTADVTKEFTISQATPDIGTVSVDGTVKDTTSPVDVVFVHTGSTAGTLAVTDSAMLADKTEYNWKFTPTDTTNYKTATGTVSIDVLDTVAPTATITVAENQWKTALNSITLGLFFKNTQTVTIISVDNEHGSGVKTVEYIVADAAVTDFASVQWTEYNGTFSINPDNKYVIYAKVTDNDGNSITVNSDGMIVDATKPAVENITNDGVYYGDLEITVTDALAGVKELKVDSIPVTMTDGKYTITADNEQHNVLVTDNAGNEMSYAITVYKNYTVTYKADGNVVTIKTVGHGLKPDLTVEIPYKEGYDETAPYWAIDNINVTDGAVITADITIIAVYTKNVPGEYENTTPSTNEGGAKLNNALEELTQAVEFTDEELWDIDHGKDVKLYLVVTDISDTVPAEDKTLAEAKLDGKTLGMYLDVDMFKQIGTGNPVAVTQFNRLIKISLVVDDTLINTNSDVSRTYSVIRIHNGEADYIGCEFDAATKTLIFETDRLSTYAVVYKDTVIDTGDSTDDSTAQTTTPTVNNVPNTGDTTNTVLWLVLAVSSMAAVVVIARKRNN